MRVGSKLASWLMMIVVLWAAMPVLACLDGADQHSCCPGAAQECSSPVTVAAADCCVVQPSPGPVLPGHAAIANRVVNLAPTALVSPMPGLPQSSGPKQPVSAASPPGTASPVHSILRI